jgi:Skp family chaperone for outer membrane proteins
MNRKTTPLLRTTLVVLAILAGIRLSAAQQNAEHAIANVPDGTPSAIDQRLEQLTSKLDNMSRQLQDSQNAMEAMRAELSALRSELAEKTLSEEAAAQARSLKSAVEQLQDQTDVLESEVKQHDQIKVESASKYPIRISGMLLFTSLVNGGNPDNIDLPVVAQPRRPNSAAGSLSATARQTIVGIDATGPHLWGARSSADLNVDFFGGLLYANYTTAAGSVRLRTAHARMDWENRTLAFAFDRPLISPWQPTSWMSVGEPALAGAGNLWTWSPQMEFIERGILPEQRLSVAAALIDPSAPGSSSLTGLRVSDAAERSRQPGYEARIGSTLSWLGRPMNFGAGGYYSRQTYSFNRHVDAWAGTADWDFSLAHALELSGQFYRGRAIGGLGGGAFKDYATYNTYTSLSGLNAVGGWGQLKIKLSPLVEVNLAGGQDNAFASELRDSDLLLQTDYYDNLARNQSVYGNLVFRPRNYLLFSTEFRELRSWPIEGPANLDRIFGLAAGYSF